MKIPPELVPTVLSHPAEAVRLAEELAIDPVLAELLVQRGVRTFEEARKFFRPSLDDLHNPFEMKDMDKAVHRLIQAVEMGERVLVYGDYDVDGTTAVAMMFSFLRSCGLDCLFYIPDRYKEGYGFSFAGVDYATEQGVALIITLDCGIRDGEKVARANERGIDVIVCDHHQPQELPPALAVLDPHRADCNYPYKGLSGCGVGLKLIQAFCMERGIGMDPVMQALDLVAISIGADIVPLTGENRVLATFGLQRLQEQPRPGILALLKSARFSTSRLTISDVVFVIAPRINAAGRMKSGEDAVRLLLADSMEHANNFSAGIEQDNTNRKSTDKNITREAIAKVNADEFYRASYSTVVFHEEWHKGVVGIVASRLVEEYYKPAIVLTGNNGKLTGSARSIPGLDLYNALGQCSDLLDQFGGHTMAAGLTLPPDNFELFRDRFDSVVAGMLGNMRPIRSMRVDAEISFDKVTPKFFRLLRMFEPFGPGNMNPQFLTKHLENAGGTRCVGSDLSHLKVRLREKGSAMVPMEGIGFGMGEMEEHLKENASVDVVYCLDENVWQNRRSIQLVIKDIRPSKED